MNRLILRSLVTTSLLLVLLAVPSIASADSVVWTLTATLAGGGTASGSFLFDGTTYSDISITTPLNPTPGYTGLWAAGLPSATGVLFGSTDPTNFSGPVLVLMFSGLGLGNSGGAVPLVPGLFDVGTQTLTGSGEFSCNDAGCGTFTTPVVITGGEVVGTVVTPEPSALALLGMGLAALLVGATVRKLSQA
jgi:hypothetical protein